MSDLATFQVGDYIILKKRIGRGAFSTIYKGYNKLIIINNIYYGIKTIKKK